VTAADQLLAGADREEDLGGRRLERDNPAERPIDGQRIPVVVDDHPPRVGRNGDRAAIGACGNTGEDNDEHES
jgi:hypothetical protein